MLKRLSTAIILGILLLAPRSLAQSPASARIFFVDIGTGAGTLIVSPTGKTLLVDGGPPGAGNSKIVPLLNTLGIAAIDFTVLSHYHIDHDGGLTEVLNAGRVAGGIAYDNGDAPGLVPPSLSGSTGQAYTAYKNAITAGGATRATIVPGQVIDLGGGMTATCLVAGGRLLSGGSVAITDEDLNSESISLLVQYNGFSFIVSGDLTGGGSTSTEKSPEVETWVGQLAGDVDVAQLNHHGSTSASNQAFLNALKAEVAVAETGSTNTFGHPNRETVNKYLNTPVSSGNVFAGTGVPAAGTGPVFYQIEQSSSSDDRESQQGYFGAPTTSPGTGTLLLQTDGITSFSMKSFDDGGVRIDPAVHTYALDAAAVVKTDFPPTVIPSIAPAAPLATDAVTVSAQVKDRESAITSVTLNYSLNGVAQAPLTMTLNGALYVASIPPQADGTRVDYTVTGTAGAQTTTYSSGYFSGVTSIATLRQLNANGEPRYQGYPARVQGLVTAGSGLFGAASYDDYLDDGTGAINIYRSTNGISTFTPATTGQTIEAVGHLETVGGRFRLDLTDSVEKSSSPWHTAALPNPIATPVPVAKTIAELSASPELFEGRLVSIASASIVSGTIPATPQPLDAFVVVSDGTGSFTMKIDHDTDIEGFVVPSVFTITGIVQQDDFLRPFDGSYDIAPRNRVDLGAAAPAPPPLLSIADARADLIDNADLNPVPDFIPDRVGQVVKVRGTVTSINFRPTGTEYYVQDDTAGIDIFATSTSFGSFGIGSTVEAVGTVTHFNGLTELTVTSVTPTGSTTPPSPQLVTLAQLADGGAGEAVEGKLIRVDNVSIASGSFPAAGASGNVTITDSTGSVLLRIDADTNIDGTPTPGGTFTVVALASQFDSTPPFDSGYQILPRSLSDIVVTGASSVTLSPSPLDFGSVTIGGSSIATATITNVGFSTITLQTPLTITGSAAAQFSVGLPASTTIAPGAATTVAVTFSPTATDTQSATLHVATTATTTGDRAAATLTGVGATPGGSAAGIVISEFRFRGPGGASDEFIELYNPTDSPIAIGGDRLLGSNNAAGTSVRATITAGKVIPPHRHYLLVNTAASAALLAVADQTYGTAITDDGGIALQAPTPDPTIFDQAGLSTGSAFKEGTPLASFGAANTNQGYERKPGGADGGTVDTNNNAADFLVRAPSDPQNSANAPTPAISVTPRALGFASLAAGATATAPLTITNIGATTVTLTPPFVIAGANAADFVVSAPAAATLDPGAATTVMVSFHPATAGVKAASVTVTSDGGSATSSLTGTASAGIGVSPTTFDFGSVDIGQSASTSITITNDDTAPATLTPPFVINGTNAAEFSVGAPGATALAGGESTSVTVGFQPAGAGGKTAILTITSAAGSVRDVQLSGSSACPAISIGGSLPGGFLDTPYSQSLTAGGGVSPYVFTVASGTLPNGLSLSPSGTVAGTPTVASTFTFTVQAADAVGCSGTASFSMTIQAATLTAAPSPLDLGTVVIGSTSTRQITLTNGSPFLVTLNTPLSIGGADAAHFSVGAPAATTLSPGASTTADVTFAPVSFGTRNATLTATSTGGGTASASLTGLALNASVGHTVVISEFRFRGPNGANDEFVEIYNVTDQALDIGGYTVRGSNNAGTVTIRATVAGGTMLPPHEHFLFVNGAAGTPNQAIADLTYGTGVTDDGGVAIVRGDGAILDQVGLSAGSAYREGSPLASLGASNLDRSYERKPGGAAGGTIDTGDNSADFQLITPSAPETLASPATPPVCSVITLTGTLQSGTYGAAYAGSVAATGGTAPYIFTVDGALPAGLRLGTDGQITGTPTAAGTFTFAVVVTDAGGCSGRADFSIEIAKATLAATADNASREFGSPNPSFSGSLTGVVNGDAITATFTTSAAAGSPEGSYPIVPSLNDPDGRLGNYTVSLTNGTLTVADTHPPVLTLPGPISATATTPSGAAVSYTASAADPVDGPRPIACAPPSGATFPIGSTTVQCSATDSNGHAATGSFVVTVSTANVPGRMTGDATIAAGDIRRSVVFLVQEHATGAAAGALTYTVTTTTRNGGRTTVRVDSFVAINVTDVSFFDVPGVSPPTPPSGIDTVTFAGTGWWNGRSGFRFTAQAVDAAQPGANRDQFAITIRDAAGTVVSTVNATITAGEIKSLRISR